MKRSRTSRRARSRRGIVSLGNQQRIARYRRSFPRWIWGSQRTAISAFRSATDWIQDLLEGVGRTSAKHSRSEWRRQGTLSLGLEPLETRVLLVGESVIFIDPSVWDQDSVPSELIAAADEVVVLDSDSDGIQQMADYLAGRTEIDAINVLSHGEVGELSPIGNAVLSMDNVASYSSQLATIGASLAANGDILLWGCGVAGTDGADFVNAVANATGADVAASDDLTGSPLLGGDWDLEYTTGPIEATNFFAAIDPQITLSHFRGGSVTHTVSALGVVNLEVFSAWRSTSVSNAVFSLHSGPSQTGSNYGSFTQTSNAIVETGTELGGAGFSVRQQTFSKPLPGPGTYYAAWSSCCRVSGIQNPSSSTWELETAIVWDGVNASASPTLLPATIDVIAKGQPYTQYLNSSDPDGTPVNYQFITGTSDPNYSVSTQIPGINLDSLGAVNISATNTASMNQGRWVYKVRVTDGNGAYADRDVMVVAQPTNGSSDPNPTPPVLSPIGSQIIPVGTPYSFNVTGTDPDGEQVTVRSQLLPPGATMPDGIGTGTASSTFNWTPALGQEGTYFVNFETFESGESVPIIDNELVQIQVVGANDPPVLDPIGNKTVANGGTLTFTIDGSDPNGDGLTYSDFFVPAGATFNPTTREFSWTPSLAQYNNTFTGTTFRVTDDGVPNLIDEEAINITVGAGNEAPVFDAVADIIVSAGTNLSVPVTVNDTGAGQTITLTDILTPIGSTFTSTPGNPPASGSFDWTPNLSDFGTHTVRLRAEDNGSPILSSTEEFRITVISAPPTANAGSSYVVDEGTPLTLNGSGSIDDVGIVSYEWDLDYDGITFDADLTPGGATVSHTFDDDFNGTIAIRVTDGDGLTDIATTSLTVNNAVPELSGKSVTSPINEDESATFSGTITDPGADTFELVLNWGDGTADQTLNFGLSPISSGGVSWDPSTRAFTADHQYLDDGTSPGNGTASDNYSVTIVSLTDDDGGVAGTDVGGNIFLTGHDVLLHGHQSGFDTVILDYLRGDGTPQEIASADYDILYLRGTDRGVPGGTGSGFNTSQFGTVTERTPVSFSGATEFASVLSTVDAVYIPWIFDLGSGSTTDDAASAIINTFAPQFEAFINAGGDVAAESSVGRSTFYDFLPPSAAASGPSIGGSSGFMPTAAGTAIGITTGMINGHATHNRFTSFDPDFTVFETRGSENISIGIQNAVISDGGIGTAFSVTVNNVIPTLDAAIPDATLTPSVAGAYSHTVNFTDPGTLDVHTVEVDWDGDTFVDEIFTVTPAGTNVRTFDLSHTYTTEGTFTAKVTLKDDDLGVATDTFVVTVILNDPPTADANGPYVVNEGGTVALDASGSSDPDQTTASLDFKWDLDGDGTFGETGAAAERGDEVGISPTFSAAGMDGPDSVTVDLLVTDDHGETDTATATITVSNVAPAVSPLTLSATSIDENGSVSLNGTFSDPGTLDVHTVTIDWGDGTSETVTLPVSQRTIFGSHQYLDDGTSPGNGTPFDNYTITATVADDDTGVGSDSAAVTVNNVGPSLDNLAITTPVNENDVVTLSGDIIDPGTQDVFTLVVDWDEGLPETFTIPAGSTSFSVSHQYLDDNPTATLSDAYDVTIVSFTDDDGGTAGVSLGGNIFLTGHDILSHGNQNGYSVVALDYLRGDGNPGEFARADYDIGVITSIATSGFDPRNGQPFGSRTNFVMNTSVTSAQFTNFLNSVDVIVIPEYNLANLAALSTFSPEIETFFNSGGDIYVDSSNNNDLQYSFLPTGVAAGGAGISGSTGFAPTAAGAAIGIVNSMVNGSPTHNIFTSFASAFTVLEVRVSDNTALTIGAQNVVISTGGGIGSALGATINNVDPVVTGLSVDLAVISEDGSVTVTGSFTDVGTQDTHSVSIDWGLGETSSAAVVTQGTGSGTFTATYQYLDDNPTVTPTDLYTITATVTDDDGGTASSSVDIAVNNVDPIIQSVNAPVIDEDGTATISGSFADVGTLDTHTVEIDWGDGSTSAATVDPVTRTYTADHQYLDDNPTATASDVYTIGVTLTDDDMGQDTASTTVTVNNVAPTLVLDAVAAIDENGVATLTGTITDPGTLDSFTLDVDWGDPLSPGNAETVALSASATGSQTFTLTHQYLDDNPTATLSDRYSITATVTDDDGGTGQSTNVQSVTINFTGEVSIVNGTPFGMTANSGDPVSVSVTYDLSVADTMGSATFGSYPQTLPSGFSYTIGSNVVETSSYTVFVFTGVVDGFVVAANDFVINGTLVTPTVGDPHTRMDITLNNNGGDSFSDDSLPFAFDITKHLGQNNVIQQSPQSSGLSEFQSISFTLDTAVFTSDGPTDVQVNNVAPTLVLNAVPDIDENGVATLTGTVSDPGTLDTFTLDVDWGDSLSPNNIETITLSASATGSQTFTLTHQYLDDNPTATSSDVYTIGVRLTDDDTGEDTASTTVTVNNLDPVIIGVNAPVINEDGTATVSGSFSDVGTLDTHTVEIDWGDGTTSAATVDPVARTYTADHQYLDDNPTTTSSDVYTIGVTLTDDDMGQGTASTTVTVNNVAPSITAITTAAEDCGSAHEDDPITLDLSFDDIGSLDVHTVVVDWGDSSTEAIVLPVGDRALSIDHDYLTGGVYTIIVTVSDDDSGADSISSLAVVSGVGLQGGVLQIIGTSGDDHVTLNQTGNGTLKVHADFIPEDALGETRDFSLADVDRIFMLLCNGDDHATVSSMITLDALIDGGAGDDHLNGGGGSNLILGRGGNDHINGGSARDILIGGLGTDRVIGNPGRDLISGGVLQNSSGGTDTIGDESEILAMQALFAGANDAEIDDWRAGNEDFFDGLGVELVDDQGAADQLTGSSADDWFVQFTDDVVTDISSNGNNNGGGNKGKNN